MNSEKLKPIETEVNTTIDLSTDTFGTTSEPSSASRTNKLDVGLHRGLKARHIQMIALGGTIGKNNT